MTPWVTVAFAVVELLTKPDIEEAIAQLGPKLDAIITNQKTILEVLERLQVDTKSIVTSAFVTDLGATSGAFASILRTCVAKNQIDPIRSVAQRSEEHAYKVAHYGIAAHQWVVGISTTCRLAYRILHDKAGEAAFLKEIRRVAAPMRPDSQKLLMTAEHERDRLYREVIQLAAFQRDEHWTTTKQFGKGSQEGYEECVGTTTYTLVGDIESSFRVHTHSSQPDCTSYGARKDSAPWVWADEHLSDTSVLEPDARERGHEAKLAAQQAVKTNAMAAQYRKARNAANEAALLVQSVNAVAQALSD